MSDVRLPVHVLTGFLGSGKTTVLNRLLATESLADSAVVVNELGEIGIDHLLVERSDDRLVELAGGCLCCQVRGDLAKTLAELLARRDAGEGPAFSRIIIETTGAADPVPVVNLLVTDRLLSERTRLGRVVTTVDAASEAGASGPGVIERFAAARRQIALADHLLVTKPDLAPGAAVALGERLAALNPRAAIEPAVKGAVADAGRLFADMPGTAVPPDLPAEMHVHDLGVETFTVIRVEPLPAAVLALLVEALAEHLGPALLRVKGLVALREQPDRPAVLHGAQHVFHPLDLLPAWPDADRRTRLVFITERPVRDWVERLLDALVWEVGELERRLRPDPTPGA